jgi:hypothetical protein
MTSLTGAPLSNATHSQNHSGFVTENTTSLELYPFPSSGEGRETPTLLGPVIEVSPSPHLKTETDPVSEISCFLVTENSG